MGMIEKLGLRDKERRGDGFLPRWSRLIRDAKLLCMYFVGILAIITTLAVGLSIAGPSPSLASPDPILSNCTATVLSGKFWTQSATSGKWQGGTDGMVLEAGTVIRTGQESKVLLTFFEGSTIVLESNTEIRIEQLSKESDGCNIILLRQFLGRTWSLVEKLTDIRSRYEIQTPSANAMVRGTSFIVDVNDGGSTHVGVTEGVVAMAAQGAEVPVPAGFESSVNSGTQPSTPVQMDPGIMQQYPGHNTGKGNTDSNDNGNSQSARSHNMLAST